MSHSQDQPAAAVCNIGPRGVRRRATIGAISLLLGLGLGAWAILAPAGWPVRGLAVALILFGALALVQARAKT